MIARTDKSVLFFIPWSERWIVETTDTDWSGDPGRACRHRRGCRLHPRRRQPGAGQAAHSRRRHRRLRRPGGTTIRCTPDLPAMRLRNLPNRSAAGATGYSTYVGNICRLEP
jgi:hypothetical protein